jgi:hypothetical protein
MGLVYETYGFIYLVLPSNNLLYMYIYIQILIIIQYNKPL